MNIILHIKSNYEKIFYNKVKDDQQVKFKQAKIFKNLKMRTNNFE